MSTAAPDQAIPTPAGILVIDKGLKFTSMDVCAIIRTRLRRGGAPKRIKVGHGGTLDPLATGVLVVLVGKCTRLCDAIMVGQKEYATIVDLSAFTTTDDLEGPREEVAVTTPPTRDQIEAVLPRFVGDILQMPPAFSALKIGGRKAYDLAREGKAPPLEARPVRIDAIRAESYDWPRLTLHVTCGKGVYIRSLARDIGTALGTGGHLAALRRTRVGAHSINDAVTLDALPDVLLQEHLRPA
ncbi:MAG: tRNA pseudouridine(55) synthase TruB [Planctomycetota bacterium]|nr:tRNA pseudouridine(55) synthase TruB [Planctomycetota bacterium]